MGYHTILRIRRLEDEVNKLGFRMGHPKHGGFSTDLDVVALFPRDNELPVYSRDAELFCGTIKELEVWLRGVQWARTYYSLLRVVDDKKVKKKEQDCRNEVLMQALMS